ncbi:DUF2163 domain-containing protein [Hirschia litorea]|uniref:DUF2163 domain-containing protein n=1 Tax=Hirschia litorea TaxID=1199156 RepID=A0ABW2III4_9PROT
MKNLEEDFAVRLKSGVATLCLCWKFERKDGHVFGATDHDRELVVEGVRYLPDRALSGVEFVSNAGLAPGGVSADSALSADFVTQADLLAGVWDGAKVDVWRVDWMYPDMKAFVWSGFIGDVTRSGDAFRVDLVSAKAKLEMRIGRLYTRQCDADFGDARCGVDVHAHEGEVCDKSFAMCRDRFSNHLNFQGFPFLPGMDAILAGPSANGVNDGGKR